MMASNASSSPSTAGASSAPTAPKTNVQEFSIRVPKNTDKRFNIMRFNCNSNVDFLQWKHVRMERENNKVDRYTGEEMPKYGAGSEYRREEKEEARRRRLGFVSRHYNPDDQPWILKCGGKNPKKFRGIREGGVAENAAYYVFTHGSDGSIEAYPAGEWYDFKPIQRFKALSAEEAELEFGNGRTVLVGGMEVYEVLECADCNGQLRASWEELIFWWILLLILIFANRRNKSLNYFNLMKRFGKNEEEEKEEEGTSKKRGARDLKISDMDDWIDSDDDDDMDSDGNGSDDGGARKKKKKAVKKKPFEKKKNKNSDESAFEESDDGDEEGRELDYISDSSEDISDHEAKVDKEMKGVDEEDALRKLLTSDEEEDEENEEKKNEEVNKSDPDEHPPNEETSAANSAAKNKKRKKESPPPKPTPEPKKERDLRNFMNKGASSSECSASSDSDCDKLPKIDAQAPTSSGSPGTSEPAAKKPRLDASNNESGISEEAVRRYLTRKPMTAKELLQKFKKMKTNLSSEQLVNTMTQILKRINPIKHTIRNKMFLSLGPDNSSTSNS